MPSPKFQAAIADAVTGTTLIMVGMAGALARLGVLDLSRMARWNAIEHWWPLLLIIAGLITWLVDIEQSAEPPRSERSLEMPYGK
jgi:hypothetical protein